MPRNLGCTATLVFDLSVLAGEFDLRLRLYIHGRDTSTAHVKQEEKSLFAKEPLRKIAPFAQHLQCTSSRSNHNDTEPLSNPLLASCETGLLKLLCDPP